MDAIGEVWSGKPVPAVLSEHASNFVGLPGYNPEYILYALNWILEQEDVNYTGRPAKKQQEIDDLLAKCGIKPLSSRAGSQLAMSLFCNVASGAHPVEAFIRANLDVLPVKRAFGAK